MHIARRQARNLAWYDSEGEPSSHNPFKKSHWQRPRRTTSIQLEEGGPFSRSLDDVRLSADQRRRRELNADLGGPETSNTFPPESAGSGSYTASGASYAPEPSKRSDEPIYEDTVNVSSTRDIGPETEIETNGTRTRQRKGGLFDQPKHHDKGDPKPQDQADEEESKLLEKPKFTVGSQLRATIFNSWINVLILAAPAGIALHVVDANHIAVFVVNFIAIIPLAAMLSYATEEIAIRTGETIGGLLNASFGNAVELIISIIALVKREVVIVQTSLIGSMLSNLLLVLGMCFFAGGVNRMEQHFNVVVAQTAASLLTLAVASLIIPTAFLQSSTHKDNIAALSRGTSVLLLLVYGCYLFFQLKSHTAMYNEPSKKVEKRTKREGDASRGIARIGEMTTRAVGGSNPQEVNVHDPDDEPEQPKLSIVVALLTLAASTTLVAVCAEFMVDSISALTENPPPSRTFVGLVLLPIVGNAAEHATAVTVACKDKMDLAIGVAVGSSMQIALLVLPLIVVLGWIIGVDDMTLNFHTFEVVLLFVSVLLVNYLIGDGKSHWLEGILLMVMYLVIAVAAWFF